MPISTRDELNAESLMDAASFSARSTQPPGGWIGHLALGAWVVRQLAPTVLVELGTHTGNSYFSFCQSVVEAGLATKCFAIDTWRGDAHSGEYDEQVFADVHAHNEQHYAGFSRLLRMTFDAALEQFADGSIELFHLDGLHTYE